MIDMAMAGLRWVIGAGVVLWLGGQVLDWIGPSPAADLTIPPVEVPEAGALDGWLAGREAAVPALRPEAAKQIVWAGEAGARTPLALVYLHGYSASREEVRPLPDLVAGRLGANLFYTRLSGHGRDGDAMAEPQVADWMADLAEAVAVGRRLGDRVVLIGSSTGGALAIVAAADPQLRGALAGVALLAPNLRVGGVAGRLIEWPGVAGWGPWLVGAERGFTPRSDGHARHWTTRYPTRSVATLGALTRAVRSLDVTGIEVPALIAVSDRDRVIDVRAARRLGAFWGGPADLVPVTTGRGDDPAAHVIAGDILSPGTTEPLAERLAAWARAL